MVYVSDLKSDALGHKGSSPFRRTIKFPVVNGDDDNVICSLSLIPGADVTLSPRKSIRRHSGQPLLCFFGRPFEEHTHTDDVTMFGIRVITAGKYHNLVWSKLWYGLESYHYVSSI